MSIIFIMLCYIVFFLTFHVTSFVCWLRKLFSCAPFIDKVVKENVLIPDNVTFFFMCGLSKMFLLYNICPLDIIWLNSFLWNMLWSLCTNVKEIQMKDSGRKPVFTWESHWIIYIFYCCMEIFSFKCKQYAEGSLILYHQISWFGMILGVISFVKIIWY